MTAILPPQPQKELKPIPPPNLPWAHIGIDLICDVPTNEYGFKHALVVTCYLSKFTAARPWSTKDHTTCQGPEFRSQVMYLNLECRYIWSLRLNRVCTNEVSL